MVSIARIILPLFAGSLVACGGVTNATSIAADGGSTEPRADVDAPRGPDAPADVRDPVCAPDETMQGIAIVACGFGPSLALIGVDEAAIYAISGERTMIRIDKATHAKTVLHPSTSGSSSSLFGQLLGVRLQGGALYWSDWIDDASSFDTGILALDGKTALGVPRVVVSHGVYSVGSPIVVDDARVYWGSVTSGMTGPLMAAPLGGGPAVSLSPMDGDPFFARGGYLYFGHRGTLQRIATAGGEATEVMPSFASGAPEDLATDGAYVYAPGALVDRRYPIVRYPVAGGAPTDVFDAPQGTEIPFDMPSALRVDGHWLYYTQHHGTYGAMARLDLSVDRPSATPVAQLASPSPPVFDDAALYVAYVRGGGDGPIEGVIGRLTTSK